MLEVIGAGFGRTGTASLKAALEHLGFGPCYHMFEIIAAPERIEPWGRAVEGGEPNWAEVFDGYRSTVDWPGCAYWSELAAAHPGAKVILSVRDPQRWYDSVHDTIYQFVKQEPSGEDALTTRLRPVLQRMIWDGTFDGRFEDRAHAVEVFERHNERVRRDVPEQRLLEFRVEQGWEPLCRFLDAEVPAEPFPHVNDAASIHELLDRVRSEGAMPSPFHS